MREGDQQWSGAVQRAAAEFEGFRAGFGLCVVSDLWAPVVYDSILACPRAIGSDRDGTHVYQDLAQCWVVERVLLMLV